MAPSARAQIVALQTLFAAWHSRELTAQDTDLRAARLAWASECLAREVSSFSDLSSDEARRLIDVLKRSLGQALTREAQPWRRVPARDRAKQAGTAGRNGVNSSLIELASPDDLARIEQARERLGWTAEQLNAWLRSNASPLKRSGERTIRTVAEANRVWWALKAMMVRAGVWKRKKAV
jgi:uncharacterized protein (DUF1684 family)